MSRFQLESLVKELDRQAESKVDFVADSRQLVVKAVEVEKVDAKNRPIKGYELHLTPGEGASQVGEFLDREGQVIKRQALQQLADKCSPSIPWKFFEEMLNDTRHAQKLADLSTHLIHSAKERVLIRSLDGNVRAFLSSRYRIMDHYDTAFTCLKAAKDVGGEVLECQLTDRNMRIAFTTRSMWESVNTAAKASKAGELGNHHWVGKFARDVGGWDLPGGNGTVHPLVVVSNSETGHGGYNVSVGLLQAICVNGAIVQSAGNFVHLGKDQLSGLLSQETIAADSRAIMLKARDLVLAAFKPDGFGKIVQVAREANEVEIKAPTTAVDLVVKENTINQSQRDEILGYFLGDYDRTVYGLAQAVARAAQDVEDADTADNLARAAGGLMAGAKPFAKRLERAMVAVAGA